MKEALRRHEAREAKVIPVILRSCDWHDLPFGKLQAATRDGRAVVKFPTLDDGFLEVLFAHANAGGFAGTFTETANMDALRAALLEVAKKSLSERVSDVLITDIVRQDT